MWGKNLSIHITSKSGTFLTFTIDYKRTLLFERPKKFIITVKMIEHRKYADMTKLQWYR